MVTLFQIWPPGVYYKPIIIRCACLRYAFFTFLPFFFSSLHSLFHFVIIQYIISWVPTCISYCTIYSYTKWVWAAAESNEKLNERAYYNVLHDELIFFTWSRYYSYVLNFNQVGSKLMENFFLGDLHFVLFECFAPRRYTTTWFKLTNVVYKFKIRMQHICYTLNILIMLKIEVLFLILSKFLETRILTYISKWSNGKFYFWNLRKRDVDNEKLSHKKDHNYLYVHCTRTYTLGRRQKKNQCFDFGEIYKDATYMFELEVDKISTLSDKLYRS